MTRLSEFLDGRSLAEFYETHWVPHLLAPFARELVEAVAAEDRVLDVGCGTGLVACLAAERAGAAGCVVGVDPTPEFLSVARTKTLQCPSEWIEACAEELPLRDASFDVVLCNQVWQYVSDPAAAFRQMQRVAKPGGRIAGGVWSSAASQPAYGELETAMGLRLGAAFGAIHSLNFGGLARLRALAEAAALTITRLESIILLAPFQSIRQFVELQCVGGARARSDGGFAMGLFDLDDARFEPKVEALVADMEDRLAGYVTPDGFLAPVSCDVLQARA